MIVKTKILCYSTDLEEVGVDSDAWYEAAIDLTKVIGVRQTADKHGDPITGELKVYMMGGYDFIIKYNIDDFLHLWRQADVVNLLNLQ